MQNIPTLLELAQQALAIIERAQSAGLKIDDGNVIDLLADNMPRVPLETLRHVLVVAGLADKYADAWSRRKQPLKQPCVCVGTCGQRRHPGSHLGIGTFCRAHG